MKKSVILSAFSVLVVASCASVDSSPQSYPPVAEKARPVQKMVESKTLYAKSFHSKMKALASDLAKNLKRYKPSRTMVVVTTFVPVGKYETSEAFGQLCSEQMLISLSEINFRVYDMRKTKDILVRERNGFFSLSNRIKNLKSRIRTDLVLVGSYALVGGELMINAILERADNSEVVSSATQLIKIKGDTFLEPLVSPLSNVRARRGSFSSDEEGSITIREPALEKIDSSSKALPLKIEKLARDIVKNLKRGGTNRSIIITTCVDLDHLNRTNSFGRYVTEHLMGEFTKLGFSVIEVRAAKEIYVVPNIGEMVLTRNMEEMMNRYKADAMILGTYQKLENVVKVHTRMVEWKNQEVISSASMELKAESGDKFMEALFRNELDRISLKQNVEGYEK